MIKERRKGEGVERDDGDGKGTRARADAILIK